MAAKEPDSLQTLRVQLKTWERSFQTANGGRKPSKADIAADPSIAAKYRQYNARSQPQSARHSVQHGSKQKEESQRSQDQGERASVMTPRKSVQGENTPRKSPTYILSPTPQALRNRLGPTPQKDGQILGLFDCLPAATPSRTRIALAPIDENVAATPSRKTDLASLEIEDSGRIRLSRTPTSSGKRYLLDTFATPTKRRRDEDAATPSTRRTGDTTPQFLRRIHPYRQTALAAIDLNEGRSVSDRRAPFKKRPLVRSLSSIIRSLKDAEEAQFDDDLEAMREMEAAEGGVTMPRKSTSGTAVNAKSDGDKEMPLGPDMPETSDVESEDGGPPLDKDGKPRKAYKKKGQKRTTRQVKMRPAPRTASAIAEEGHNTSVEDGLRPMSPSGKENKDPDFVAGRDGKKDVNQGKKKRKVNELAHTNFCRLKIKNKNSKANGRGRFGRR